MDSLKITLFGSPHLELNGTALQLRTRKALALLVLLAVNRQPHSRETLAALFWPEFSADRAFANLREALRLLKQHLSDHWLTISRQEVTLKVNATLWVDVLEFQRYLEQGQAHAHPTGAACAGCLPALLAAIALYREDFLHGFTLPDSPDFDEWQSFQTDLLREKLIDSLKKVIRYYTAQHELSQAILYARRWVALDPGEEAAQRELIRLYALNQQRSAALQQYQDCARILREELGAEPEQETQALYEVILGDNLIPILPHPSPLPKGEGDFHPSPLRRVVGGEVLPPPNNLPAQTTSFIGREAEVASVVKLLSQPDIRLLTLTGAGGSGKTRLSLQAAARLCANYVDGVFFVSLAPISNPDFVISTIVTTLGLQAAGNTPPLNVLKSYLQPKQMLLILDNFEQIIAAALVLSDLLAAAPHVNIMVTSRTVLRLSGEQEYLVPPLKLPNPTHLPSLDRLMQSEAVQLFAERARAVHPEFTLNAANVSAVAEICTRLDGLPLAIELAAARVRVLPPEKMLARLGKPLDFLTGGARDLPARQRTLRHIIEWSYHLLDAAEQILFRRLAVFVGGCTLEAAEVICPLADHPAIPALQIEVLDGVESLVDKHLLTQSEAAGEPRFVMLATIRAYALERLAESGEADTIRRQHARFFLTLAEGAAPYWDTFQQVRWLDRFEAEHNNLRAALAWSIDQDVELGLRLAVALEQFWDIHAHLQEGRDWVASALTRSCPLGAGMELWRTKALHTASVLAEFQGDLLMARSLGEESLRRWRSMGNTREIARCLQTLGMMEAFHGDLRKARPFLEESIALYPQTRDPHVFANALWMYGYVLFREQDYTQARARAEESLRVGREMGHTVALIHATGLLGMIAMHQEEYAAAQRLYEQCLQWARESENSNSIAVFLSSLGILLDRQGHYDRARAYYAEALKINQQRGHEPAAAWLLSGLGRVTLHQQQWQVARTCFAESLQLFQKYHDSAGIAASLIGLAGIAEGQGQTVQAAHLLGAIEDVRPKIVGIFYMEDIAVQAEYDRLVAAVRSALGAEAFAAAIAAGRALTLEQAIALALADANLKTCDSNLVSFIE